MPTSTQKVATSRKHARPGKRRRPRTGLLRNDCIHARHIFITDSAGRLALKVHAGDGGLALRAIASDSRPLRQMVLNPGGITMAGGSVTWFGRPGAPTVEAIEAGNGQKLSILHQPTLRPSGAERAAAEGPRDRNPPQVPYVRRPAGVSPDAFGSVLDGDCMEPKYHSGDVVLLSRSAPVRSGTDCLVVRFGPDSRLHAQFKRVFLLRGGAVRLHPLNPRHEDFTLEANDVVAIIRAVAVVPRTATLPPAAGSTAPSSDRSGESANRSVAAPPAGVPAAPSSDHSGEQAKRSLALSMAAGKGDQA